MTDGGGKEGSFQSALGVIAEFDTVRLDSTANGLGQSMVAAAALSGGGCVDRVSCCGAVFCLCGRKEKRRDGVNVPDSKN